MKLTLKEFKEVCATNNVTCRRTGLRADFSYAFPYNDIQVGGDNDKESFDVGAETFSEILFEGYFIHATYSETHARAGEKELFEVLSWESYKDE